MITQEDLKLKCQHRPLAEIAMAQAEKNKAYRALKVKAKTVMDGYKAQLEALSADLDKLSDEFMAASIAAEGGR